MVPTQEGAPFLTGRKTTECSKKRTHACQKQRNPAGRWRRRKDCLFLWYFLLGKQKKVQMPGKSGQARQQGTDLPFPNTKKVDRKHCLLPIHHAVTLY
jgi:hypothetical protein